MREHLDFLTERLDVLIDLAIAGNQMQFVFECGERVLGADDSIANALPGDTGVLGDLRERCV